MQTKEYRLLSRGNSSRDQDEAVEQHRLPRLHVPCNPGNAFIPLMAVLSISLITNFVFIFQAFLSEALDNRHSNAPSLYAHLPRDISVPFTWYTEYSHVQQNDTNVDELWESIDIDAGIVAIPDRWAASHDIPLAARFPWDKTNGVYVLTSHHNLHCLKNIRRFAYDAHHGLPPSRNYTHVIHCLDSLRQDVMCDADDTPRTTLPGHFIGIGQSRQCRDWNKYIGWTKQFDSCYAHITDNKRTFYEIERFKFCPEGSPYLPAVRDHFGLGEDWNREKGLKELREKTLEELGLA